MPTLHRRDTHAYAAAGLGCLLAVDQPRPVPDPAWVDPLRARLEDTAPSNSTMPVTFSGRSATSWRMRGWRPPPTANVCAEKPYLIRLADGRVQLRGVPDLVLGRAMATQRQVLLVHPPAGEHLRLVPGPACRWCRRAPGCPAAVVADAAAATGLR